MNGLIPLFPLSKRERERKKGEEEKEREKNQFFVNYFDSIFIINTNIFVHKLTLIIS